MAWVEGHAVGVFVNMEQSVRLSLTGSSPWRVIALLVTGDQVSLKGDYDTEQDAANAARVICLGVDPTTATGGS